MLTCVAVGRYQEVIGRKANDLLGFPTLPHAFHELRAAIDQDIFVPNGWHAVGARGDGDRVAVVLVVPDDGGSIFCERKEGVFHAGLIVLYGPGEQISHEKVQVRMAVLL